MKATVKMAVVGLWVYAFGGAVGAWAAPKLLTDLALSLFAQFTQVMMFLKGL